MFLETWRFGFNFREFHRNWREHKSQPSLSHHPIEKRTTQDHTGPDKTKQDRGRMDNMQKEQVENTLREILPKTGLVYSERGALSEILCKPKIMPLKSAVLEKIQKIEGEVEEEEEKAQQGFVQFTR
jgi:BBSome-interacting protein 1